METAVIDELERLEAAIAAAQERLMGLARSAPFAKGQRWREVVGRLNGAMFEVSGAKSLAWYILTENGNCQPGRAAEEVEVGL